MFDTTLPQPASDSRLNIPDFSYDGRHGLPNSVREALFALKQGKTSLVIDALLYTGLAQGTVCTFKKIIKRLYKHNIMLPKDLVRQALNSGVFQIGLIHSHRRGRPEKVYTMPHIEWLVRKYANGAATASDPLVHKDIQNLRLYRQALHREFIRRAPGIYSRAFLGGRLGVGKRCTRNYDQREGIRAIRRHSEQNLRVYMNWEDVVRAAKPGVSWLRIYYKSGKTLNAPPRLKIAQNNMWKRHIRNVTLVTQLCNRYVYDPAPDWADRQPLYLSDDERSFAGSADPNGLRKQRLNYDPKSVTLSIDSKAYQTRSDSIASWVPPELAARRTVRQPHLPRYKVKAALS